jgi:uncharacterized protein (TIGR03437 family)
VRFAFFFYAGLAVAGQFATSLGDAYPYQISAITTDAAGNTYVVGSRELGTPPAVVFDEEYIPPNSDVFVSKLDPNGKLVFTDTFGGKGVDSGFAVAVDPAGNIYVAGTTTSFDFPLSNALQTQPYPAGGTGFIVKLSNDGATILYSTYFGGALGPTDFNSIATDSSGNLFLTGATGASDFPHTTGMPSAATGTILLSISAAGDKILYSGVVGAGGAVIGVPGAFNLDSGGVSVAVDAAGNAYFAGNTGANNLPTTPGVLGPTGFSTGFLAKVNAGATSLGYLTYLPTNVFTMAADADGNTYVPGFHQNSLTKINPSATAVVWTYNLGATADSIAIGANGNVWASGQASSTFPNANGWSTGPEFLAGVNAAGTQLIYSALFPFGTVAQSVAVDPAGFVHAAGITGFVSAISPSTAPTMTIFDFQNAAGGSVTARIAPAEVISIYGPAIGPAAAAVATPSGGFYPNTLGGVQVTINGMNMPLLYVSANQINAVVPMEVATGAGATVHVVNGAAVSPDYPVWIVTSAPEAFLPAINQDGTVNSQSNPAKGGSTVTFYATGWQSSFAPLADGQVATVAKDACLGECQLFQICAACPSNAPTATVLYGGTAPGIVAGVTQFNIEFGPISTASEFSFAVTGPSTVIQTVWVAP